MRTGFTLASATLIAISFSPDRETLMAQSRNAQMTPVSLTGRVLEKDGRPATEPLQVDLMCNGRLRMQTLTTPDGTFHFDMDPSQNEAWLDPGSGGSMSGSIEGSVKVAPPGRAANLDEVPSVGRGRVSLSGCEVRLSPRPGMTSKAIAVGTRGAFENPDIGVIVIHRLSDSDATAVSLNTLSAPNKARDAFEKANTELASKSPNFGKALKQLEKAVQEYPAFSAAWDLMARAHLSMGNREEGQRCFLRAIEAEPKFLLPYLGLAQLTVQQNQWAETQDWTEKILALDSGHSQALYWHGLAAFYTNQYDQADRALSSLYEQGHAETYPFGLLPLGVIHAGQGKIQAAAEEFQRYLQMMPADQVPEAQRIELENQLAAWKSEGLATLPDEAQPEQKRP